MRLDSFCDKEEARITFERVMLCFPLEIFSLLFAHLWADEILLSFSNIDWRALKLIEIDADQRRVDLSNLDLESMMIRTILPFASCII